MNSGSFFGCDECWPTASRAVLSKQASRHPPDGRGTDALTSNLPAAILERIQSGRIGWARPVALATARTGLILLVQVGLAIAFLMRGDPSPWRAQAPWWTVYATLVDSGCLLLLWRQAQREGIRF